MEYKCICCLTTVLLCSDAARILGIFPGPSFSHQLVFQTIMKALVSRGHQVTVISTDPLKEPMENYTDVDMSFMYDYVRQKYNFTDYQEVTAFGAVLRSHPNTQRSFDLVFLELSRYQCYYGLVHHVGSPPVIGIRSVGITTATLAAVGSPNNPSYFPDNYLPYSSHMTFFERVHNTALYMWNRYYFGFQPPSVWKAENNVSLVMVNNHWSQSYPLPLMPSIIQLGNIHLQEKSKELPKRSDNKVMRLIFFAPDEATLQPPTRDMFDLGPPFTRIPTGTTLQADLKEFLDGATEGAIYFSLGTNVRSETMSPEKKMTFLSAFSRLPQRVLWKRESDDMPGLSDNVKLAKWLPQQDVLAHPNMKLFITQGGLQSFHEATHYAVPMIGIPFICDQQHNVRKMVDAGVGLKVDYSTITNDSLVQAINKILHDPREHPFLVQFGPIKILLGMKRIGNHF
ncbi:hypothetical protein ANN_08054 [Periplaneta americana]|uniref:Glucuronosyltransferase n=1 Tax=Periplaneta americana TaxID=6978 RepID=A0ABQ8T1H7_PERAM|nr:hypothetical protein ANN_08054 [Periplaneta americana]